jgi:hypothetical protein
MIRNLTSVFVFVLVIAFVAMPLVAQAHDGPSICADDFDSESCVLAYAHQYAALDRATLTAGMVGVGIRPAAAPAVEAATKPADVPRAPGFGPTRTQE